MEEERGKRLLRHSSDEIIPPDFIEAEDTNAVMGFHFFDFKRRQTDIDTLLSTATDSTTSFLSHWQGSKQENKHQNDPPPHPQQSTSSRPTSYRRMASKSFSRIATATSILLDITSSLLLPSSDLRNPRDRLKYIKAQLYNVETEVIRDNPVRVLLKELKDLTTQLEDIVDASLYTLMQILLENENSGIEAFPVTMQMDKNIQVVIPHDISERIKILGNKFEDAFLYWKSCAKPENYISTVTLESNDYDPLRAHVLDQPATGKASAQLKGAEKDEVSVVTAVSADSTSSRITINKGEETNDEKPKNWEAACHSKEDRKRLLAGSVSDPPPNIQICGRDIDKEYIIKLLLSDITSNLSLYEHGQDANKFHVIRILGKAGVGKTTLAKSVHNDPAVCEHFDVRGWVRVTDDTTDVTFQKDIINSITGKSYGNELNYPQTVLHEELFGKRLLLVLDDVKSNISFPWESMLALLSKVMLGKIIITSKDQLVDRKVYGSTIYHLGCLPIEKSWDLFKQCAFNGQNPEPQDQMVEIGRMILCKCNNLPLNVKILGSLLNFRFDKNIWIDVLKSEIWKTEAFPALETWATETFPALVLSYNLLPGHLKPCFLYCSTFPKGYKFDKYELVRLWMAQDYLEPEDNERLEDLGCEYFFELERMSFFEKSWDGTFTMHDLLYVLAKYISQQEFYSIKDSDAWDIDAGVCHLYVVDVGGYQTKNTSIFKPLALKSLLYQISDGQMLENLLTSSSMKRLRTLVLKRHDDHTTVQKATQRTGLDEATLSSLNYGELIHLRYLQICDKHLESLPTSVCKLYHLQTLILDNCSTLSELPNEIGNLFNLRYLGLSKVNISMLPESVCRLLNLHSLIVDYCRNLNELPGHIGDLISLHNLGLPGTNIIRLPESICCLSKVKILKMDNCEDFVELPSNIGNLINLQEIEVSGSRIARLPDSVCSLFNLWKLDVAGSDLQELPSSIGQLLSLNYLGLSHTNIYFLPESLCQLLHLHTLKLNGCTNLSHLPNGIGALISLHHLLISDTDIEVIPESICQLSNLHILEVDGCRRCHILPGDIGDLINLRHLKLSDTDICELPASFCRLSNLETLELNGCYKLSQLPDNLGDLSSLCKLEITETKIKELPKSFCHLSKLKKLKLNGNKNLEEFPTGIENLASLTHLEICEVGIKKLPEHIGKLTKLVKLNFESKYKPSAGFDNFKHA